jgi:hypothetical protein
MFRADPLKRREKQIPPAEAGSVPQNHPGCKKAQMTERKKAGRQGAQARQKADPSRHGGFGMTSQEGELD